MKRTALRRKTPLRRVSAKRKAQQAEYAAAKEAAYVRDGGECQARAIFPERPCGGPLQPHHILCQNVYPELRCDSSNIVWACDVHHALIDLHSDEAKSLGLKKVAWLLHREKAA